MNAFRDEREAMLERLHQLEEELAGVRDAQKREEILRELSALANRVEVATRRVAEDGKSLDEIGKSIDRMRATIDGGKEPDATPPLTSVEPAKSGAMPGRGAFIVSGSILGAGILAAFVMAGRRPSAGIDLTTPASSIPGFPHAVDPSALVAIARSQTHRGKDSRLTGIRVDYVGSNGLVDLRATGYDGRIAFSFTGPPPPPPPASSAPLGAPQPSAPIATIETVSVTSTGMSSEPFNLAMGDRGLADPLCSVRDVWAAARNAGAPADAIAVIEYGTKSVFEDGHFHDVTRWHFTIRGTSFDYDIVDPGCQLLQPRPIFKGSTP